VINPVEVGCRDEQPSMNSRIAALTRAESARDASTPAASTTLAIENATLMIVPYTCV
jgi:hypothetical protein